MADFSTKVKELPTGAILVGQQRTLFDGKILYEEDDTIWTSAGTGTATFSPHLIDLSVGVGEYYIRQSRRYQPYFSGKPQVIEMTFADFDYEPGVVKRIGYFSSSSTPPYDTDLDGFFIENDGETISLQCWNFGTRTVYVPIQNWANSTEWLNYNWEGFSVIFFYFLWLGGASLRMMGFTTDPDQGARVMHDVSFPGTIRDTITRSPNHPVRYEIRSTTGTGALRAICSTVTTAGSIEESGKSLAIENSSLIRTATQNVDYFLLGIRKRSDRRDVSIKLIDVGLDILTNDGGELEVWLNPTLSAAPTWNIVADIEWSEGNGTITVSGGRLLYVVPVYRAAASSRFAEDFLTWLAVNINDIPDEIIVSYKAFTPNQDVAANINLQEFR